MTDERLRSKARKMRWKPGGGLVAISNVVEAESDSFVHLADRMAGAAVVARCWSEGTPMENSMARQISFAAFEMMLSAEVARLARSQATGFPSELDEYVEFDPLAVLPKLAFRPDALTDDPPPGFDLDEEVYKIERAASDDFEESVRQTISFRVVAEGDSWFNLPSFMFRKAIADYMAERKIFATKNIARWGHTLAEMLAAKDYMQALSEDRTDFFLISGGGNDLVDELAKGKILHQFEPARPVDEYLTVVGHDLLEAIQDDFQTLLAEVVSAYPSVRILTYGYDYPRPCVEGGRYIGKHLLGKYGIPWNSMDAIIIPILDRLNVLIEEAAIRNGARYLNCRHATHEYLWYDDMHPKNDGYEALAIKFEKFLADW